MLPLADIHLYSNYNQEAEVNGNGQSVSFLFLIAFFIIGIAVDQLYQSCRQHDRWKGPREVGVRKVMGAVRRNLIVQFLVESFLINLIAVLLALSVAYLITPSFNQMIGRAGDSGFSFPARYWIGSALVFLSGCMLSGLYPAFVLSGFQPVSVLKGLFKSTASGARIA
jgi:putative ABC transport system permease protein